MAFNNLGRAIIVIRFEYHRGTAPGSWFLPCGRSSDGQWKKVFSPFWPHSCPYSDQMLKLITWIIPSSKFLIFFSSEVYHQPQNIPQISYFLALGQPKTSRKKKKKITVLGRLLTSHICSLPQGQPPSYSFPLVSDTSLHSPAAPSLVPALQTSHPLDYVVPLFPSTGLSAASVLFLSFSL